MITLTQQTISAGFDGRRCWVHARAARVPAEALPEGSLSGRLVMTLQQSIISSEDHVSDVFSGLSEMTSDDDGGSWTPPLLIPSMQRWSEGDGIEAVLCDFTPQWLPVNQCLLGFGVTARYRGAYRVTQPERYEIGYCLYDHRRSVWGEVRFLSLPGFGLCSAGCIQWVELPNGELLVPFSWRDVGERRHRVSVARCRLAGGELTVVEVGETLEIPFERGFVEPSLIRCGNAFWLTLRNDYAGYLAVSSDGLRYTALTPWHFCNGTPLGSYNTQQHWLTLGERLFLVYTRMDAGNADIVRHRAPLFIAEVDMERRCLLQETERIVAPNRGAPLGNFGVSQDGGDTALICVSEWMETAGEWNYGVWSALEEKHPGVDLAVHAATPGRSGLCELSGADNTIYLVRAELPTGIARGRGEATCCAVKH